MRAASTPSKTARSTMTAFPPMVSSAGVPITSTSPRRPARARPRAAPAPAAAAPPLSGHEGGPEPRDAAPHGEPLRPQEADETGGRLDLLQAQLGAEVQ